MKTRLIACLLSVLLLIGLTGICAAEGPYWGYGSRESAVEQVVEEVKAEPAVEEVKEWTPVAEAAAAPEVATYEAAYDWYYSPAATAEARASASRGRANTWIFVPILIIALIILLPAILIPVLVSSGKKKRAAARAIGPKTEYRYRCRACGHTFCFTDLDLARHRGDTTQLSRCPACRSVDTMQTESVPLSR